MVRRPRKRFALALVTGAALAASFGLAADEGIEAATPGSADAPSATIHLGEGRQTASFRLPRPEGVILLYRISAPAGTNVRGYAQLPSVTVPLQIRTSRVGPSGGCTAIDDRIVCTVGMEWCPMPEGVWHFRVVKLAGPAGDVTITFKVGPPPGQRA
jgi:hypothetical protein